MKLVSKTRKSFRNVFWRNHKVVELRREGKTIGWYGKRFPNKTAQEIVEEVVR